MDDSSQGEGSADIAEIKEKIVEKVTFKLFFDI